MAFITIQSLVGFSQVRHNITADVLQLQFHFLHPKEVTARNVEHGMNAQIFGKAG